MDNDVLCNTEEARLVPINYNGDAGPSKLNQVVSCEFEESNSGEQSRSIQESTKIMSFYICCTPHHPHTKVFAWEVFS